MRYFKPKKRHVLYFVYSVWDFIVVAISGVFSNYRHVCF